MDSPRVLRACDYCYTKKMRCDRRLPCDNCSTAKIACLRQRPKQSRNHKNDRLDQVLERMSRLEDSIRSPSNSSVRQGHAPNTHPLSAKSSASSSKSQRASVGSSNCLSTTEFEQPDAKRQRLLSSQALEEYNSNEDKALASLDLQRYFKLTRQKSLDIDAEQQAVLGSAVSLAKQAMAESKPHRNDEPRVDLYDRDLYPSAEFLHLLLHESSQDESTAHFLGGFGVCDRRTLEEMIHQLLSGGVHDQQRVRYIICVNHAAYAFLAFFKSCQTAAMTQELMHSKTRYKHNILASIRRLDTTAPPSLYFLYALQCAATMMQDLGQMRMCWKLNTVACRVGAALKTQSPLQLGVDYREGRCYLRTVLIRCYILDTALSANLYQPACLEDLDIDPSVLDTNTTSDALLGVMLSYAQVHEVIIHETRKCANPAQLRQMDTVRLMGLRERMLGIQSATDELRNSHLSMEKDWLRLDWLNLDFVFYSTMTSVIRLGSRPEDTHAYQECLEKARSSLMSLVTLLEAFLHANSSKRYLSILAKTIPLFTLRPLYFCFRHLIETSDAVSLKILRDTAQGLALPAQALGSIKKIADLCHSLISLYTDFKEKSKARTQFAPWSWNVECDSTGTSQAQARDWSSGNDPPGDSGIPRFDSDVPPLSEPTTFPGQVDWFTLNQQLDWELWFSQTLPADLDCPFEAT